MAKQLVNRGAIAGDGTGETLFDAFTKINANADELYAFDAAQPAATAAAVSAAIATEVTDRNSALAAGDATVTAAYIAADTTAIAAAALQAKVEDGEYTEAGVLVWPGNAPAQINYSSPGVISSITKTYGGVLYTMTFAGSPPTLATVTKSAGGGPYTKAYTYNSDGTVDTIGHWV